MSHTLTVNSEVNSYVSLLIELVDGACEVAICNSSGDELWSCAVTKTDLVISDTKQILLEAASCGDVLNKGIRALNVGSTHRLYVGELAADDIEPGTMIYLLSERSSPLDDSNRDAIAVRVVNCLGELLGSYDALNLEINSMIDELAKRYEELNLVYNTDESIRTLVERETLLRKIVENCVNHLEVDAAALFLGEREGTVAILKNGTSKDFVSEVNYLREPIFALMERHSTSVVLNTDDERKSAMLDVPYDRKLVISPIRDVKGRLYGSLVIFNNSQSREFENSDRNLLAVTAEKLSKIVGADYDELTGLMTREGFETSVRDILFDATQLKRDVCLLHANIDQLQLVNDTFGHGAGDALIQEVSAVLPQLLRGNDRLARLGGDEFGILLLDCTIDNAINMANRLCDRVSNLKCEQGDRQLDVGISVGITKLEDDVDSVIGAMATADLACSVAKEQGRNRALAYRSNDKTMKVRKHQMNWVGKIQSSLKTDEFVLFSQVIEPTDNLNKKSHFEILLRMLGQDGKILSPSVFMPVAERYHMMPMLDQWVIDRSLTVLERWQSSVAVANSVFAINLSGQSVMDNKILKFLQERIGCAKVDPQNICFEITESAAITNLSSAQRFVKSIKRLGCQFALDDFGAGVSSFTNLRALDVDYLKIDGSFVVDMATDPVSASMVAAINQVGQTMELNTVAEFVESQQIREILTDLGVDYLQGYHIDKPRPLSEQLQDLARQDARSA